MQRTVLPIVYEDNDPAKIRAAFKAGCGGVIVDSKLPDSVAAELENLASSAALRAMLNARRYELKLDDNDGRIWAYDMPALKETSRWLEDEYSDLIANRLAPSTARYGVRRLLTVWPGTEFYLPWHIDKKSDLQAWPDMHIHLYGAGMMMASPQRSLSLQFNDHDKSPKLRMPGNDHATEETLQQYLEDRGFTFINLKPGQRIHFRENCLHKSSYTFPEKYKLRAAIF